MPWRRAVAVAALLACVCGWASAQPQTHFVVPGDTLTALARRYDTTVAELRAANGMSGDLLRVGQRLRLPAPPGWRHLRGAPEASWGEVAARNGIDEATLRAANPGLSDPAGSEVRIPPADGVVAWPRAGEDLLAFATRVGAAPAALARLNGLTAPFTLAAGEPLVLPEGVLPEGAALAALAAPVPVRTADAGSLGASAAGADASGGVGSGVESSGVESSGVGGGGEGPAVALRAPSPRAASSTAAPGSGADDATAALSLAAPGHDARAAHAALRGDVIDALPVLFERATLTPPDEGFAWPLAAPPRITSSFGWRAISVAGNRYHQGLDLGAAPGTAVRASRGGVVTRAGWVGAYGYAVYVRHESGYETRYAHLSRVDVRVGDVLGKGDTLGRVGSTGASTGPHLHFEARLDGRALDPLQVLPRR